MFKAKRVLCIAMAAVLLLVSLAGCSAPKLVIGGTANTVGTVGETSVATGEYLAYMYNFFYDYMYNQGLYQYAGQTDIWAQELTYGEGDDAQKLTFDKYLIQLTKDTIIRQEALRQMLKENELSWDAELEAELAKNLETMKENEYLSLGISNENFIRAYKELNLNETSLFYGLYREGGKRAVSEADRRAYYDENYVSFKIITMSMTDANGSEMEEEDKQAVLAELNKYLAQYNKDKNFEAVMDSYNAANATEGTELTPTTDEDNRVNLDATMANDAELVKAVREVEIGQAKVVTYKSGGSTLTGALIVRLDPKSPETVFVDETDNILYGMKHEEFNEEIEKKVAGLTVKFKNSVVKKCDPRNFLAQ